MNFTIHEYSKEVIERLIDKKQTLAVAESLTGGLLTSALCDISGASKVLMEGIVSYSEQSKQYRLGVHDETLKRFSPVSEQTAREMALGVRASLDTDFALATTGVAGPGEFDDRGNPKGLFFIALATRTTVEVFRFQETGDRRTIREKASQYALRLLYDKLISSERGKI